MGDGYRPDWMEVQGDQLNMAGPDWMGEMEMGSIYNPGLTGNFFPDQEVNFSHKG